MSVSLRRIISTFYLLKVHVGRLPQGASDLRALRASRLLFFKIVKINLVLDSSYFLSIYPLYYAGFPLNVSVLFS